MFRDGLKTSLPILQRQCHPRTGKYDTIRAVLISHSSSCEKYRDHETLWCLYPTGYIVKSFSGFEITELSTALPVIKLLWRKIKLVSSNFPTRLRNTSGKSFWTSNKILHTCSIFENSWISLTFYYFLYGITLIVSLNYICDWTKIKLFFVLKYHVSMT